MQTSDDRALLVPTTHPDRILTAVRKSKRTPEGVLVYWGYNEARKLAALGFDAPSPMLRDYAWCGRLKPFDHQKDTASFLSIRERAFCFNEQGTAKTGSVIAAADYLMKIGKVTRVLVLCPLSIMKSAWQGDLFKFAMHRSHDVAHGTAKQRKRVIESGVEFVIMNFDGLAITEKEVLHGGFDLIVVDECNAYKNPTTTRWKVLNRVVHVLQPRLWMLTGTPAAHSPLDAFGLAKLVNPGGVTPYFGQFRDQVMVKVSNFRWVPKRTSAATLHRVLQPAIRYEKKDCLDLPPVTFMSRDAPLTKMQKAYYVMLKSQLLIDSQGEEVSAVHAAAKLTKLLQISGGAVYTDEGNILEFDVSSRLKVIEEVIDEASHKVLVFVPFNHTIDLLYEHLTKRKITCASIDGRTKASARNNIIREFQNDTDPQVLILQPAAAAHGLTLTAADTIIWYAPVTSTEIYLQANARIDRPGQLHPMTIVHIRGSPVEDRLYSMLQGHINDQSKLIDLYRSVIK